MLLVLETVGLIAQKYFGDVPVNVIELTLNVEPLPPTLLIQRTLTAVPLTEPESTCCGLSRYWLNVRSSATLFGPPLGGVVPLPVQFVLFDHWPVPM